MAPSGNTVMSIKMVEDTETIQRAIVASESTEMSTKTIEDTDALDRAIRLSQVQVPPGQNQMLLPNPLIVLKVVRHDDSRNEIHFPINVRSHFRNLKESYAQRVGVPVLSLRFLFNGRRLSDEETPRALEMEGSNIIEVFFGRRYSY